MIYNNLIINKPIYQQLLSFYNQKHLPNAFIFHGNEGVGKEAHAIEFFSLLNCYEPTNNQSCGNCNSCIKTKKLQHELLNIIVPFPRSNILKKNDPSIKALSEIQKHELIEHFEKKGRNPYYTIQLTKGNTILINSIKDIKNNFNLSIPENKIKVHMIFNAEKLCYPNQESANALLKILEEPSENNMFILITSEINKVIDTIISRCTSIYFPAIETKKISDYMVANFQQIEYSQLISKISAGNIKYALELKNTFQKKIELFKNLILSIENNNLEFWKNELNNFDKNKIIEILSLLYKFFKDLELINTKENDLNICFDNFSNIQKSYLKKFPNTNWSKCMEMINNTQNYIVKNGYAPLMITALFIEIRYLLNKEYLENFELNKWLSTY